MATITTRAGKGSPLTNTEVDDNFSNLNSAKYESGANPTFAEHVYLTPSDSAGTNTTQVAIGHNRAGNGYAHLDFVGDATYSDYGLRILRGNGGENAFSQITHRGTNKFYINMPDGGSEFVLNEGSYDTDFRVESNDNSHMLFVDAGANTVGINKGSPETELHVRSTSAGAMTTFESSSANSSGGPNIRLWRNSASPADGDGLARLIFQGNNDAAERIDFAEIQTEIVDASDGTEYGLFQIETVVAGASRNRLLINGSESVFNDGGRDLDFRVESNDNSHMLFVDAGNNKVIIGSSTLPNISGSSPRTFGLVVDDGISIGNGNYTTGYVGNAGTDGNVEIVANAYPANLGAERYVYIKTGSSGGGGPNTLATFANGIGTVLNDDGAAGKDFRVESDSNTHALFVDAGNDRVGVGEGNPEAPLHITGGASMTGNWKRTLHLDALFPVITFQSTYNTDTYAGIGYDTSNDNIDFWVGATTNDVSADGLRVLRLKNYEAVFNEFGGNVDFRVESDTNSNGLFFDASASALGINKQPDANGYYALDIDGVIRQNGTMVAGVVYPYSATVSRALNSPVQWYKIYSTDTASSQLVNFKIHHGGDNTNFWGEFTVNLAGYTFEHNITLNNYTYYNEPQLLEIFTRTVSSTNLEVWVKVDALTSYAGNLIVQCSSGNLISSPTAVTTEPSGINTRMRSTHWPGNSSRTGAAFSKNLDLSDAAELRLYRSDDSRYSRLYHNNAGLIIETQNSGDNVYLRNSAGTTGNVFIDNGTDGYSVVVNDISANTDFRVESNNNTHMLFVDAGNDRLGVNKSTPSYGIHAQVNDGTLALEGPNGGVTPRFYAKWKDGDTGLSMGYEPGYAVAYIDNTYPRSQGQVYGDIAIRTKDSGSQVERLRIIADKVGGYNVQVTQTGLRVGRSVYNWFQYGQSPGSGNRYLHMKTTLWSGANSSNSQPTMSLFHVKGYTYDARTIDTKIGFHNWLGGYYNLRITDTGSWAAGVSPYTSSDGYVVLVLDIGTSYPGISIDWHQSFEYSYQNKQVSAYSASSSSSGVY